MKHTIIHIGGVALGFLLSLGASSNASSQTEASPAVVEVAIVEEKAITPNIWVPGTVISREDSNVAAEVAGLLTQVSDVGERVRKGDVLARVNDRQLQFQLRQNQAQLERLKSQLAFAEKQLARTQSLLETSATAQFRIDELRRDRDVLAQEVVLAEVDLEQTRYFIDRSAIKAPFTGVVADRFHQPGEHIAIGEELLRLVNTERLEVSAQAPVEVSSYVGANDSIVLKTDDAQFDTQVRSVVPVGDQRSRMIEVRVQLQGRWVIGDAVSVSLSNGPDQIAKTIPRDALVLRDSEVFVFRVNGEGLAEKINVVPGIGDAAYISVKGPLNEGDKVVTRGAERLDNGRKVSPIDAVAGR